MAVPHRDDTPSAIARRQYHYDKPPVQPSRRSEARFTVIPSLVGPGGDASRKDQFSIGKIQTAFGKSGSVLGLIPAVHKLM
jgi:hypothetical protein